MQQRMNRGTFSGSQSEASGMEFLLGDLFSVPRSSQSSVEEAVDMELSVFRADKGLSLDVEPLQWWRTKAVQFPLLATAARAYLAAPAVAGNAVQEFLQKEASAAYKRRGNIPPESLDSVLFLHHNHMPTTENGQTRRTERVQKLIYHRFVLKRRRINAIEAVSVAGSSSSSGFVELEFSGFQLRLHLAFIEEQTGGLTLVGNISHFTAV